MKSLAFTSAGRKAFRKLSPEMQARFIAALTVFAETGRGDVVPLEGQPGDYRLRVGGFRVLFHDDGEVVDVFHAASRGQIYK